jgi:type III restriction enzyme
LEILDRVCEISSLRKDADVAAALSVIRNEFKSVVDFEREFPSLCFALATGVGKTRLMGAFISYLHQAHGINNFFVLAPNLTIYSKLIADFTPNTPKYVFTGIAEFATSAPTIITGDNYEAQSGTLFDELLRCKINIFNISKIDSEVRGGRAPRIKRLSEYIGQSYFDYLTGLPDLVLIMDESHRYRAKAGVRAINELRPVLGLELTATPFVESARGPIPFQNVIYDYPLGKAMADGFVKEPAVVTRKDFNPVGMSPEAIEQMKLEDGVNLHESVKVQLETYSLETGRPIVKPFLLVIARDITHAGHLMRLIESDGFFRGQYRDRVIQVDSSKTGADEEAMIDRLLKVERADEPTEIVIHVNMLKEGWDVTNLYTIVPLRAANARTLIEQSIGRGLRLPYGKRTGVAAVDRLNIVAHDRFQEIVDEANKPDSVIRVHMVELDPGESGKKSVTVVAQPNLETSLGLLPRGAAGAIVIAPEGQKPAFPKPEDEWVARLAIEVIEELSGRPDVVPTLNDLQRPEIQAQMVELVKERMVTPQISMEGVLQAPDVAHIVKRTSQLVEKETIPIPRIVVAPKGDVRSWYEPFKLKLDSLRYPSVSKELFAQYLRTGGTEVLAMGPGGADEERLENYVVRGLMEFDDVAYDDQASLLYDLAAQVVTHFKGYLLESEAANVLRYHQREIARHIHAQMQEHYKENAVEYGVKVSHGFMRLRASAFTAVATEPVRDYRHAPEDKSKMTRYLFGGFERCLFHPVRFQSDTERLVSVILDRDSRRWFRPARGQFRIYYRSGSEHPEYQPDFVAETDKVILMLESKMASEMTDPDVIAKRDAAVIWCKHASDYAAQNGGKPWAYVLVPHNEVAENMTLEGISSRFTAS